MKERGYFSSQFLVPSINDYRKMNCNNVCQGYRIQNRLRSQQQQLSGHEYSRVSFTAVDVKELEE